MAVGPFLQWAGRRGADPPVSIPRAHPGNDAGEVVVPLPRGVPPADAEELAPLAVTRPPEPWAPDPAALVTVEDRTSELDETGLSYLFQKVRTDAGWNNDGDPLSTADATRAWKALVDAPERHRGQEFLVEGTLVALERGRIPLELAGLASGNPSGLERYFTAFLYTGETIFLVAVADAPEAPFSDRAGVRVRGTFLQLYQNDVEHEGTIRKASVPVLVGRSFTPVIPAATPGVLRLLMPSGLLLIGCFLVCLIVCALIARRGRSQYQRRLEAIRAGRRPGQGGHVAGGAGPLSRGAGENTIT
jgi:hypothetical protein